MDLASRARALVPGAVAALLLAAAHSPATAQSPALPPLRCAPWGAPGDTLGTRALPFGHQLVVRRDRGEVEGACSAVLTDREGHRVIVESGFGVRLDEATGWDINGDGAPDLVLEVDVGGGNRCCRRFAVVSLGPPAGRLFEYDLQGAASFRRDGEGRVTLWSWEGGLFGPDRTMASRLFAYRVYRFFLSQLSDVTAEHCPAIAAGRATEAEGLDSASVRRFAATRGVLNDSTFDVAGAIQGLMLQHVFCRRFDEALAVARALWPAATLETMLGDFRRAVVGAFPEYRAGLAAWP